MKTSILALVLYVLGFTAVVELKVLSGCEEKNCSHSCVQKVGSNVFKCSCPTHLALGPDRRTCTEPVYILLSTFRGLSLFREDTKELKPLVTSRRSALDYNHARREIYAYNDQEHAVFKFSLGEVASLKSTLQGIKLKDSETRVTSLAADWLRDELYWICEQRSVLEACSTNGSDHRALATFKGTGPADWRSLAIDPYARRLFWLEGRKVRSLDMTASVGSGGRLQELPLGSVGEALALDTSSQLIYVVGSRGSEGDKEVVRMHYDGSNKDEVLRIDQEDSQIHGFGVLGQVLYWHSTHDGETLYKYEIPKTGDKSNISVVEPLYQIVYDMKIYHPDIQKPMK